MIASFKQIQKTKGSMMKLALITLNYNDFTGCEKVVQQAKLVPEIDYIIVVDNCSPDGSYERLKAQFAEDGVVVVVQTEKNGGYSYGYNWGFRIASRMGAACVALCNSDILFNADLINNSLSYLQKDAQCAGVSARQLNLQGGEQTSAWKFPRYKNELKYCFFLFRSLMSGKRLESYPVENATQIVDALSGCFTCFRLSALEAVGLYDENVFLYNEENIIGKKLAAKNFHLVRLNEQFYVHAHTRSKNSYLASMRKILEWYNCRYYYQCTYGEISIAQKIIFKLSIYIGACELYIFKSIKSLINKTTSSI